MANYVYNRVICSQDTFHRYFWDHKPFGEIRDKPYITFNQLVGVNSLMEYNDSYGVYIYYGYGFIHRRLENDQMELLFATRWYHPIEAIKKAVEIDHDLIWYAAEENVVHISKFYWDGKVREDVYVPGDIWDDWYEKNVKYSDQIKEDPDDDVWDFLADVEPNWVEWPSRDSFQRYFERRFERNDLDEVIAIGLQKEKR